MFILAQSSNQPGMPTPAQWALAAIAVIVGIALCIWFRYFLYWPSRIAERLRHPFYLAIRSCCFASLVCACIGALLLIVGLATIPLEIASKWIGFGFSTGPYQLLAISLSAVLYLLAFVWAHIAKPVPNSMAPTLLSDDSAQESAVRVMPTFEFWAVHKVNGIEQRISIEAFTREEAENKLYDMGYYLATK